MHFSTVDKEKKRLLQIDKEIAQHKLMVAKVTRLHRFLSKTRVLIVGGLSVLMLENTIGYGTQMFIPYNEMQALKEKLRQDIASYEQLFLEVGQISIPLEEQ